jgi:hypothetical protein
MCINIAVSPKLHSNTTLLDENFPEGKVGAAWKLHVG